MNIDEIWKPAPDFENLYEISNFGNVFSHYVNRKVKPQKGKDGSKFLIFRKDGKKYQKRISKLVAQLFVSNPNNYQYVKHIDGNLSNDYYKNLTWSKKPNDAFMYFKTGDFVDDNKKFIYIDEACSNDKNHRKIKVKSVENGEIFESNLSDIRTGHTKYPPSLSREKANLHTRIWKQNKIKKVDGYRIILLGDEGHDNFGSRIYKFKNLDTEKIFVSTVTKVLSGNTLGIKGLSRGEQKIKDILEELNIMFITEYTFNDCLSYNGNKLRFDFYLPDYNTCIEYDGEQHFRGWRKSDSRNDLSKIQERDEIKNKYCENNNIFLIRIPYTDFKNISKEYIKHLLNNFQLK